MDSYRLKKNSMLEILVLDECKVHCHSINKCTKKGKKEFSLSFMKLQQRNMSELFEKCPKLGTLFYGSMFGLLFILNCSDILSF